MNITKLKQKNKNIGAALMQMAMMASSFSASAASAAYYSGRRGGYSSGKTKSYLVDAGTNALSRNLFSYQKVDLPKAHLKPVGDIAIKASSAVSELLIVDQNIKDYQQFNRLLKPGVALIEIPQGVDGFAFMLNKISQYHNLQAVHLFSHANAGELLLGNTLVNTETLKNHPEFAQVINGSVKTGGDFLLYGCELGKGEAGDEFLEIIKSSTHADVAASDNLTGNIAFNGDWDLEIQKGDIEAKPLANSVAMKDFTEMLQIQFSLSTPSNIIYAGDYYGGASSDVTAHEDGGTAHTLKIDGQTGAVSYAYSTHAVNLGSGYTPETDKIILSFTNGAIFDIKELTINNWLGSGDDRTFTISTDQGGSVSHLIENQTTYTFDLTNLPNNATKLYIKADADFNAGLTNVIFTSIGAPAVTTVSASNITANSADLSGNVISAGSSAVTARGIVYSSSNSNPAIGGSGVTQVTSNSGTGTFSETVSGLSSGTTYYLRTYATNSQGTSYGAMKSFTTLSANTPPTLTTSSGTTAFTEGTAIAIDNGITVTDADNSTLASATVSITGGFQPGQDVLSFTNDGSTMGNIVAAYFGGTGVLNLSSSGNTATTTQWQAALRAVKYNNVSDDPDNATRTISFTVNDGTANSTTVTKTVSITAANDAPTATNLTQSKSATESGSAVALDDIAVSDPDGGEIITATLTLSNVSAGTLSTGTYGSATSTFNAGTGVWTVSGSVSDVNAALAAVAFTPSANNDQNFSITTRIRDAANTGPVDGTISFTVTKINDAPILDVSVSLDYGSINEDSPAPVNGSTTGSRLVSTFTGGISDPDTGAEQGIAIIGADNTNGTWWFSIDGGITWNSLGSPSASAARLLYSSARIYFQPVANYNGTISSALTIRAWDRSTGSNGGQANITGIGTGGTTPFSTESTTVSLTVTAVNDAPTLSGGPYSFTGIQYSQTSGSVLVSTILSGLTYADPDAGAQAGIAVFSRSGSGWQYSTDEITWANIGSVISSSALLLDASTYLRYVAGANGESPTLDFRAWDRSSGTASTNGMRSTADVTTNGGSSAYSSGYVHAQIIVTGPPTIFSATYDANTGILSVSGANITSGGIIDVSKLTLTGQGNSTYTLTGTNVTASSTTDFLVTLNAADKLNINGLLNKNGAIAADATSYNLAAAANWDATASAPADATGNGITVSNVSAPSITSASYDANAGVLTVTGSNMVRIAGSDNDITASKLTLTGEGGSTYTLTSSDVEITSGTSFSITLNSTDRSAINQMLNKNGTTSTGGTTYNIAAADDWNGTVTGGNIADPTGNGIAVSNVDETPPTITDANISISGASGIGGTFKIGDTVTATWDNTAAGDNNSDVASVSVDFSQFSGGSAVAATNSAGTWTATYTLTAGSIDATDRNISITATDNVGNHATTVDATNAVVDNIAPTVTDGNISISGASGTGGAFKIGDTVTASWNNTAGGDNNSDTITGLTVDFSAFGGGSAVAATNSSGTWTATYTLVAGNIQSTNKNISVTATDNAGNQSTTTDASNATVDNSAPTVSSVTVPANGTYVIGQNLEFTVNFSENVTVSGTTPSIALTIGSTVRQAVFASKTASAVTFSYTVQPGDSDADGITIGSLTLNSATVKDAGGNDADLTLSAGSTSGVLVDGVAPTVTAVSAGSADGTYKIGDPISLTVAFSEAVTVTGTPQLTLETGTTDQVANYSSGTGTNTLVFSYTVQAGDNSADLDYTGTGALGLNSGTIEDAAGNSAVLILASPGNAGSLASNKNLVIDGIAPTVAITSNVSTLKKGETATITFTFSEAPGAPFIWDGSSGDITVSGGTLSAISGSGTNYTATFTPADDTDGGTASITIAANSYADAAGNGGGAGTTPSLTFDTKAPTTTVATLALSNDSGSSNTDFITNVAAQTISGTLSANLQTGETVEISLDEGSSWTTASTATGQNTYTLSGVTLSGSNSFIKIQVKDAAGNTGTVFSQAYTLDTTAPAAPGTPDLAAGSDSGSSSTDNLTKVTTPEFTGTTASNTTVNVYDGSTFLGTATVSGTNWSYTASGVLTEGNHTITARATDMAGNVSSASTALTITIDVTAPAAPAGFSVAEEDTKNTLSWTANSETDLTGYKVYSGTSVNPTVPLTGITAGTNTYTHTVLTNGTTYYYRITATDGAGNESVYSTEESGTPKGPQTIAFAALPSKAYGDADFAPGATASSGLTVSYSSDNTAVATIVSGNIHIVGAGTAVITASQSGSNSYTPASDQTQTLTVAKKELTAGLTGTVSKTYDGNTAATLTAANYSLPGIEGSDAVSLNNPASGSYDNKNKGSGKTVSVSGLSISGADADNYQLAATTATAAIGSITAKALTVTATGTNKVYDSNTTATVTLSDDRVDNDDITSAYTAATFSDKDVGTGKAVSVTGISISGADAGNYTVNSTAGTTANITAKALTVTATGTNKVYDGNTTATVTLSDDRVSGDDITASYTATFDNKNVGTGKAVSVTGISISGTDKDNYTFNSTASTTADITARTLTVTATGINKEYDGNTTATVTLSDDRVSGDDITAGYTATFDSRNVGTGKAVSVSGIGISGTDAGNYTFNSTAGTTADITARALTVTATGTNKVYDGNTTAAVTLSDDRVDNDDITSAYTAATFSDKNIGTGKAVSVTDISISGTDAGNYTFNSTAGTTADITARALTVTATGTNKVYDGNTTATVTLSDDRVDNDDITSAYTTATFSDKNVGTGKAVNVSGIGISGTDAGNYTFNSSANTSADITARTLTVTATGINKEYDGNTTATVTLSDDRVSGDGITAGYTATFDSRNVGTGKAVSVTDISISGADAGNYTFNSTAGTTADITARTLTIAADDKEKYEGETNPVLTASYSGFITGEDSSVLTVQPSLTTTATADSPQGNYPITAGGASAQNYSIGYVQGTLTVKPGAPTSISLAGTALYENSPAGTQAGTLSSTSLSPTATFSYTLVGGTGDEDNGSFAISGDQLVTATPLNFESKQTYNIRVRSTTQYNLSLEETFTVSLSDVNEAPTLDAIADQKVCYTADRQDVALTGISAGPDAGQTVTVTANSSNNALLSELGISTSGLRYRIADGQSGTATITVTVKDSGGTANGGTDETSRTFTLTVNPLPVSAISSDRGNSISKGETAVLTVASDNGISYSWSNATGIVSGQNSAVLTVRPMETTTYTVLVTNASGCQSEATYTLMVNDNYRALKPENFFTPNGDGINDAWTVENIDAYPNHALTIFDRSGRTLYETRNYQNDWNGTANGADLQEGTYYYVFRFDDPKVAPVKGFITIVR